METSIKINAEAPRLVLETLAQHLPYSLPTLRRLQFMKTTGGRESSDSHVLSTFDTENPGRDFLVAYLDLSRGPQSEMWLYSSMENARTPGDEAACEEQVLKLLARVKEIEQAYEAERVAPGAVLVASMHKRVFQLLEKRALVKMQSPEHLKFIFRLKDLPVQKQLPDGMSWSSVRDSDIPLVLSRTTIPYEELVSLF